MKKSVLLFTALTFFAALSFAQTVILDFEAAATSTDFQFFGGNLEGALSQVIDNPNSSGINTSAKVLEFKKASDAPGWGGGFSNPNPATAVDLTNSMEVCVDVHMDHMGNLGLKLEEGTADNWLGVVENTVMNEWERLCFDMSMVSFEDPPSVAAGNTYNKIVLFLDFGTKGNGTDEVVTYIDNIVVSGSVGTADLNVVDNLFEMTPTLVSDNAVINFENTNAGDRQLSVVSTMGQVLIDQEIDGIVPSFEVQTAGWTPGLYMARVQQGKDMQVVKFLVH